MRVDVWVERVTRQNVHTSQVLVTREFLILNMSFYGTFYKHVAAKTAESNTRDKIEQSKIAVHSWRRRTSISCLHQREHAASKIL